MNIEHSIVCFSSVACDYFHASYKAVSQSPLDGLFPVSATYLF